MTPTDSPRRFTDEVLSDEMAAILRGMTPAQRLAIVDRMWNSISRMIHANLRRQHPDWTAEELELATARRMSRGAY